MKPEPLVSIKNLRTYYSIRGSFVDRLAGREAGTVRAVDDVSLDTTVLHSIPGAPPNLIDPPSGCRFNPRCPSATAVCNQLEPVEQRPRPDQRVFCWLHGPMELIPPGRQAPLEREAIGVADEA